MNFSIWMFNDIVIVMSKEVAFWLCRSILNFGLGNGICKHLLAVSKVSRKLLKLSTRELSSPLDI